MTITRRSTVALSLTAVGALALAGCSSAASTGSSDDGDERISVVASTNVYGQIAEEIGGDTVSVTSIVTSAAQDPHSFEPSAQDSLLISEADLIIENGGGYDAFVDSLIESTGTDAPVITAVEFSHDWPGEDGEEHDHADEESEDDHDHEAEEESEDHDHAEDEDHAEEADDHDHADHGHIEGFNEHVWYDPHTIEHVAEDIAHELGEIDPDNAEVYEQRAEAFASEIEGLEETLAAIDETHGGEEVFVTEPVPVYLVEAAGLVNVTPEAFSEAVEEGQDVAPATLLEATTLLESGDVAVVITNTQTGGAETTQVTSDAETLGIPVISFSETLPDGQTYISWMQSNVEQLGLALTA